jgi:hypothetical protein
MAKLALKVRKLGAKIISLKYGSTELLYLPASPQPDPKPGDVFDTRFAWGADICAPGVSKEAGVADHGNFWTKEFAKSGDVYTAQDSQFRLSVKFETKENSLNRAYRVTNLTKKTLPFAFADHFLMPIKPTHKAPWSKKSFFHANSFTYTHPSGLKLTFSSKELDWLGHWLTEGGWNGEYNIGIELTNANDDALSRAVKNGTGWQIAPGQTKTFSISLTVQP